MTQQFLLVHGGQQGAWAYDLLIPEIRRLGHGALAVELPAGDPDAGAAEYSDVVERAMDDLGEHVVLVGHSLGGLTIPLVAARRPVSRLIFVCAAYPEPGRSHMQVRNEEPEEAIGIGPSSAWQQAGDSHVLSPDAAREYFFHDCSPEIQEWAVSKMRPQSRKPLREITPLQSWPDTSRSLIVTTEDRCIPRESAVRTAQRLFGEAPIELPGGHCPMLSRPAMLARTLVDLTGAKK